MEKAGMVAARVVRKMREGLVCFLDFRPGARLLYYGAWSDALRDFFARAGLLVTVARLEPDADLRERGCGDVAENVEGGVRSEDVLSGGAAGESLADLLAHGDSFDYIFVGERLELSRRPEKVLKRLYDLLASDGTLFLALNNRLDARFFFGDRDKYTGRCFDGVENYRGVYGNAAAPFHGRMYSREEARDFLRGAGFSAFHSFSVFPRLDCPEMLLEEGYTPTEHLPSRLFPAYDDPRTVFLDAPTVYDSLAKNGMLHVMAGGFLFECRKNGALSDVLQVTNSLDRGREDAFSTVVHRDFVEKVAAYPEGARKYEALLAHGEALTARGISVVPARIVGNRYHMSRVVAMTGQQYLLGLLRQDPQAYLAALDHFMELVLRSSEHVREDAGDGEGVLLRYGYPDMVPLNSFFVDGDFCFYDQEFRVPGYPANVVLMRVLHQAYEGGHTSLSFEELAARYGLLEKRQQWERMEMDFLRPLRNEELLAGYFEENRPDRAMLAENRARMNFSAADERRMREALSHLGNRQVVLFGAGAYAHVFLSRYGEEYPPAFVVDNNRKRWGEELSGVPIRPPEALRDFDPAAFRLILCTRFYPEIERQLAGMGIYSFGIFQPSLPYPRRRRPAALPAAGKKKYHVGYIAGVFDLFHVGHLNMFRRAKEFCDYLIVGVVSDEQMIGYKHHAAFIPEEERLEMVRSCRYVDEARLIPPDRPDTNAAWEMYRFDVQFSGSDYENDPAWLAKKKWLRERGSDLVFFSYTMATSSTKIRGLIEKKLL